MFHIVVGTYEKAIFGWDVEWVPDKVGQQLDMKMIFACPAHLGCVKALDASGKWLASGSTDESIKVYDLEKKQEIGSLLKHEDVVTCLQFFQMSHLLSASSDGTICIWRTKDWECIRVLKGHKEMINSLSIHPTGKLALTCARDRSLRMWNLINGRSAYEEQLSYEAEIVCWSPSGNSYAISSYYTIRVFNTAGETLHKYEQPNYEHILTLVFVKEDVIASGGEDRKITIWNTISGQVLHTIEGFGNRIKSLRVFPKEIPGNDFQNFLVSISSDHTVKVWDMDYSCTKPLAATQVEGRLTCLAVTCAKSGNEKIPEESVGIGVTNKKGESEKKMKKISIDGGKGVMKKNGKSPEKKEIQEKNQSDKKRKREEETVPDNVETPEVKKVPQNRKTVRNKKKRKSANKRVPK